MVVAEIKLYELLKARIGEREAEAFVQILETKVDNKFEESKETLATKEDIANLRTEIKELQSHLEAKFNDQMKWMIVMWVTQLAAIAGIIKMFMK